MRYQPEHKTHTRERIIREAARKVRAEGLKDPGVARVMKSSGLTVGGFYKHFRNKDELLAAAIEQSFADGEKAYSSLQKLPQGERWKELVRGYLSPKHCDHPESGCPVAALAPEIARAKVHLRKRVATIMKERAECWVQIMPGSSAKERQKNYFIIFSAMVGAVSVARLLTDPADRRQVLDGMRDHLLRSF